MSVAEPYSALFDAIVAALVDASGPFAHAALVAFSPDELLDEMGPSEELARRMGRPGGPVALVSDAGSEYSDECGGGNEWLERQLIAVRYAVEAPTPGAALKGDGTPYWGEFATRRWILGRLCQHGFGVAGWVAGLTPRSAAPIPLALPGKVGKKLLLVAEVVHELPDEVVLGVPMLPTGWEQTSYEPLTGIRIGRLTFPGALLGEDGPDPDYLGSWTMIFDDLSYEAMYVGFDGNAYVIEWHDTGEGRGPGRIMYDGQDVLVAAADGTPIVPFTLPL